MKRTPYSERSDLHKVQTNWTKTVGLLDRGEYGMAVIRAATSVELTLNYVVRAEVKDKYGLSLKFVDNVLILANGPRNKWDKLVNPLLEKHPKWTDLKGLGTTAKRVLEDRNKIAHCGEIRSEAEAQKVVRDAKKVIKALLNALAPEFRLNSTPKKKSKTKK